VDASVVSVSVVRSLWDAPARMDSEERRLVETLKKLASVPRSPPTEEERAAVRQRIETRVAAYRGHSWRPW